MNTLKPNDKFTICHKQIKSSTKETRLLVEDNATLEVNGRFAMYAGGYIRVIKNGHLVLNDGFINEDVEITCASKITIGKGCRDTGLRCSYYRIARL